MNNRNILISGAGIAGPALAYWLHCYGFNPTVVERASALSTGGQAIDLRGTARKWSSVWLSWMISGKRIPARMVWHRSTAPASGCQPWIVISSAIRVV